MTKAIIFIAVSTKKQAEDDKASLEDQERAAREWAAAQGYEVIDLLAVRGFSRSDADLPKFLEDMEERGEYAYRDLMRYYRANLAARKARKPLTFDVLIAWHISRLGRSQTTVTWVLENVIESGAKIYCIDGGWWESGSDARYKTAFSAVSAAGEVDQMVARLQGGIRKRVARGLNRGPVPLTHQIVRDDKGKAVRLILNSDLAPFLQVLKELFLAGVSWRNMTERLADEYGFINPQTGKPYSQSFICRIFTNPFTWGRTAIRFERRGTWAWDDTTELPDGTEILGSVVPVWEGEEAQAIKAELKRRSLMVGRADPEYTSRFMGLVVCGTCRRTMSLNSVKSGETRQWYGWRCSGRYRYPVYCDVKKMITQAKVQAKVDDILRALLRGETLEQDAAPEPVVQGIAELEAQHAKLKARLRGLILDNASETDNAVKAERRALIGETTDQLSFLENELERRRRATAAPEREAIIRQSALEELAEIGLEAFWECSDKEINQWLHRIFGGWRLVVDDGEVTGRAKFV